MKTGFSMSHTPRLIEASHSKGWPQEKKGDVTVQQRWTDRRPHPANMVNYDDWDDDWANDAEANIAFNVLSDIIAGVGYYTEMPEKNRAGKDIDPEHKNKRLIDDYGEDVNLDEVLQEITLTMLQKGICPVERLEDYALKVLPPETFYIYEDKKGNLRKYTQEYTPNTPVTTWKGKEIEDIIPYLHRKTTSWRYGKSLTEPIGKLLDHRTEMNEDMPQAIHQWAYPLAVMETEGPKAAFCEGLHAPLLLYLKNATEASATVMMESVDRLTSGIQRYIKRRVERFLFEPQVGEPVPRLVWGQPKTGLEEIELGDIAALVTAQALAPNQAQDLLKQLGVTLPDPEWPKQPQLPTQPFQKPMPMPSMETLLEKLNDLDTGLNIIETNFQEKTINLVKAMQMGQKTIDVHVRRMFPKQEDAFNEKRNQEYEKWAHRLIGAKKDGQVYSVHVSD